MPSSLLPPLQSSHRLSLPPPPIPTPPPPRRLFNPRLKLTHAYVADCVHVSPFTLRVFLLRGAREEGRGSKRRRDGVRGDKSSGLFHKCATHHVHGFALSLSLSLFRHLPFLVASQYGPVVQCLLRTLMALTREHCVNSG